MEDKLLRNTQTSNGCQNPATSKTELHVKAPSH